MTGPAPGESRFAPPLPVTTGAASLKMGLQPGARSWGAEESATIDGARRRMLRISRPLTRTASCLNRGPARCERACDLQLQALHADAPTPGCALARIATAITRPHPPLRRHEGQSGSATMPRPPPEPPPTRATLQWETPIGGESPAVESASTAAATPLRRRPTPTRPPRGW
jgi:hypothetical protein